MTISNGIGSVNTQQVANTSLGSTEKSYDSVQYKLAVLQMQMAKANETKAQDYMKQIEDIQNDQKKVAEMISLARDCQQKGRNGEGQYKTSISGNNTKDYTDANGKHTLYPIPQELVDYMDAKGLSYPNSDGDYVLSEDEWDYTLQSLSNYQETIGNETQTLMLYLQDHINQYNSFLQGASSSVSKFSDVLQTLAKSI